MIDIKSILSLLEDDGTLEKWAAVTPVAGDQT